MQHLLSPKVTADDPLSPKVTADDPLSPKVTADDPLSPKVTADDPPAKHLLFGWWTSPVELLPGP